MANEFQGPVLSKIRGGIGRYSPSADSVACMVFGGVVVAGKVALGTAYSLNSLADAEALGINAAYDANNKILVWNHINHFFTYAPNGTLVIMVVAQGTTLANMCDVTLNNLKALIYSAAANRNVRFGGVVLNPLTTYTPTFATGFDTDVLAAIAKAQELVTTLASNAIYIDNIMIEGRMQSTATAATAKDLSTYASEYVSVFAGQDPTIAALDANYSRYAAVGAALGMLAARKVSECLGSVDIVNKPEAYKGLDTYSLTNLSNSFFLDANLSSGQSYNSLTVSDKNNLAAKRIIYVGKYEGLDGFYINDSHTCTTATDDYAYIEDNRVWNKAARLVRRALLPLMKSNVQVDATTGALSLSQIAYYQGKAQKALKEMVTNNELAGQPEIIIDANQNVIATSNVTMSIQYVRNGILRSITGNIAATNPSN